MRLDEVAGVGELFKDPRLDFKNTRSLMINKHMLAFKFGAPVSAHKYTNFNNV